MALESPAATLERFHEVLVHEIRERQPEYLTAPFTVAEIYQQLVPYASHRDRLGVEINGDYEDALLRLLAGQGDYLRIESDHARERMQDELRSNNPDTSLYREFAALDVRLNPERLGSTPRAAVAAPSISVQLQADELAPEAPHAGEPVITPPPADGGGQTHDEVDMNAPDSPGERPTTCSWCRADLPNREHLNYCPFCGTDVTLVPCESCGEALEPTWRFCIACGTEAPSED